LSRFFVKINETDYNQIMEVITKSAKETQKLAGLMAKELLNWPEPRSGAMAVVLRGDLGAGKTTFAQGFAKGLGVKEPVKSPTFVILKKYDISKRKIKTTRFWHFYHLDCYRLKNTQDARSLGLAEILKNPANLVLIEWPERIKNILSKKQIIAIKFSYIDETSRKISFN